MTSDQKIVATGAAVGVASMLISVYAIYLIWPAPAHLASVADRLAYTLGWEAVAALPLLLAIMTVGNNRFLSAAIDPTRHQESLPTEINARVAENTLQQFTLFLVGTLALSVGLAGPQMRIIPAVVIVFVVARAAFWIGYRIDPLYRAFGMAATGYLNVGLLGFAIWQALS
jgi:hypothetical protein